MPSLPARPVTPPMIRSCIIALNEFASCSSWPLNVPTFQRSNVQTFSYHLATKSFTIRTYEKQARNPFRIRTYKTQDLKSFRIRTYEKTPGGGVSYG